MAKEISDFMDITPDWLTCQLFFVIYLEKFLNRVEIIFKRYIIYLEIFLNRW